MDASNILISVIVPVYKVEQFMDECIDSILNQTYNYFELILVDDGSPDKCGEKCDEYLKKDSRVIVIHKKNGGLSDARNAGLALAHGDYITYVDSDDVVAPTYLEVMINAAAKYDADIVQVGTTKDKKFFNLHIAEDTVIQTNTEVLSDLFHVKNFEDSSCAKLFKSEIARKVAFPKGRLYEDLLTAYQFAFYAKTFVACHSYLYYYRINRDSIMHKPLTIEMFSKLTVFNEMKSFFANNKEYVKEQGMQLSRISDDSLYYEFRKKIYFYNEFLMLNGDELFPKQMELIRKDLISEKYKKVQLEIKYKLLKTMLASSHFYKLLLMLLRKRYNGPIEEV